MLFCMSQKCTIVSGVVESAYAYLTRVLTHFRGSCSSHSSRVLTRPLFLFSRVPYHHSFPISTRRLPPLLLCHRSYPAPIITRTLSSLVPNSYYYSHLSINHTRTQPLLGPHLDTNTTIIITHPLLLYASTPPLSSNLTSLLSYPYSNPSYITTPPLPSLSPLTHTP